MENLVNRLVRGLGLDKPPKEKVLMPWEILREKAAQS